MITNPHDTNADEIVSMLRDAARAFCSESVGRFGADAGAALWNEIAGLGWLGVAIDEESGGSASGLIAAGVIACELGRAGHTRGYAETIAFGAALARAGLQTHEPVAALLREIARGEIQLAFFRPFLPDRAEAADDHGLIPDAGARRLGVVTWFGTDGLVVHELDADARRQAVRTTSRALDLAFRAGDANAGLRLPVSGDAARAVWDDALMLYRCLAAAQLIGAAQAARGVCTDYALVRSQFGHLIGAYQAVQHTLVDMLAAGDAAEMLVLRALSALDQRAPDETSLAAAAIAFARETAWSGLMKTYDVLGGVGFIEEHPINRLTRAILPVVANIGSASDCEDAVAAHVRRGHWLASTPESPTP
jgi:alkylation response protein AidB-like acyl-CoA dehydrogenase